MLFETYKNRMAHLAAHGMWLENLLLASASIATIVAFLVMGIAAAVGEPYRDMGDMLWGVIYGGLFFSFVLFWILLIPIAIALLFFLHSPNLEPIDRALVHSWLLVPIPLVPFSIVVSILLMVLRARDPACDILTPPGGPTWIHWSIVDAGLVICPVLGLIIAIRTAHSVSQRITDIIDEHPDSLCPRCSYPLAGLPKAICPECGYEAQHVELESLNPKSDSA